MVLVVRSLCQSCFETSWKYTKAILFLRQDKKCMNELVFSIWFCDIPHSKKSRLISFERGMSILNLGELPIAFLGPFLRCRCGIFVVTNWSRFFSCKSRFLWLVCSHHCIFFLPLFCFPLRLFRLILHNSNKNYDRRQSNTGINAVLVGHPFDLVKVSFMWHFQQNRLKIFVFFRFCLSFVG